MRLYVARESTGRFFVVLRPLFFGGEIEGLGRLKGDLDLAGEELRGGFWVGERDCLGVEVVTGGEEE